MMVFFISTFYDYFFNCSLNTLPIQTSTNISQLEQLNQQVRLILPIQPSENSEYEWYDLIFTLIGNRFPLNPSWLLNLSYSFINLRWYILIPIIVLGQLSYLWNCVEYGSNNLLNIDLVTYKPINQSTINVQPKTTIVDSAFLSVLLFTIFSSMLHQFRNQLIQIIELQLDSDTDDEENVDDDDDIQFDGYHID